MTEGVGTCISIHAPTWGATSFIFPGLRSTFNFNPRTHVGCDFIHFPWSPLHLQFQSTHPRGVRHYGVSLYPEYMEFQSTHPRGVRPTDEAPEYYKWEISIHAPTWGATTFALSTKKDDTISIHAPTWGATNREGVLGRLVKFQSTHPRGVRLGAYYGNDTDKVFQSTHPRGVRQPLTELFPQVVKFQSTHPRGVRQREFTKTSLRCTFQSTHPRGVRLSNLNCLLLVMLFQSTHPRGVRLQRVGLF